MSLDVVFARGHCLPGVLRCCCLTNGAQCHFSWDWGPAYNPTGIWRDISLVSFDDSFVTDVSLRVAPSPASQASPVRSRAAAEARAAGGGFVLSVEVGLRVGAAGGMKGTADIAVGTEAFSLPFTAQPGAPLNFLPLFLFPAVGPFHPSFLAFGLILCLHTRRVACIAVCVARNGCAVVARRSGRTHADPCAGRRHCRRHHTRDSTHRLAGLGHVL